MEEEESLPTRSQSRRRYAGQPSLVSKFPTIVEEASSFIKQHGFSAHHRRWTETSNSSGVTIVDVRKHLLETIPGLKEHGISESTVSRLFHAPNLHRTASSRYTGLVDCKVGVKDNTCREFHEDNHYLFARNKQRREMAQYFAPDSNTISIDDMAKVKVGAPAVSRYHQIRKIYPSGDTPNLKDHDFPVSQYLLNVSGYMFLERIPDDTNEDYLSFDHHSADMSADNPPVLLIDRANLRVEDEADDTPSLLTAFTDQLKIHSNIHTNKELLKDELKSELRESEAF